jgi:hypothetical protein
MQIREARLKSKMRVEGREDKKEEGEGTKMGS